jgi:hypothetical protein
LSERAETLYNERAKRTNALVEDLAVCEIAYLEIMYDQERLGFHQRRSVDQALDDGAIKKNAVLKHQGQKGGKARKTDALQEVIIDLVRGNPQITERELRDKLTRESYPDLIEDVEEDSIYFKTQDGRSKAASIAGLKDRLSRAKKLLNSR